MSEAPQDVDAFYEDLLANDGWSCGDNSPDADGAAIRCRRDEVIVTGRGEDRNAAMRDAWNQTEGGLREMLRSLGWSTIETGGSDGSVTVMVSRGSGASIGSTAAPIEQRGATEREALAAAWEQAALRAENQD